MLAFAGGVLLCAALVTLRRTLLIVTVRGKSMEPTFVAGDRVLVRRRRGHRVKPADVIILRRPPAFRDGEPLLLKRVAAAAGDPLPITTEALPPDHTHVPEGQLVVLGDNPEMSSDSRGFGYLPEEYVVGVVLRRIHAG